MAMGVNICGSIIDFFWGFYYYFYSESINAKFHLDSITKQGWFKIDFCSYLIKFKYKQRTYIIFIYFKLCCSLWK